MINANATARFAEIKDLHQFMNCDGIGVHTRGLQGETPLKIAVVRDDVQIVTDLLEAGADPNLPGEDDCTPLHHAASHGHIEIIGLLLSYGASAAAINIYGDTPADIARRGNDTESCVLLAPKVA